LCVVQSFAAAKQVQELTAAQFGPQQCDIHQMLEIPAHYSHAQKLHFEIVQEEDSIDL
jgi:hypothetical protein